jgi:hypothetical protein
MICEITAARPRFVVVVWVASSWMKLPEPGSPLFGWMQSFVAEHYRTVGVVDLISFDRTVYKWLEDAGRYEVQSDHYFTIFERVGEGAPPG